MTRDYEYEIAEIAYGLKKEGRTMTESEMKKELIARGFKAEVANSRGYFKQISTIQNKFKDFSEAIADCLTNDKGELVWKK